MSWSEISRGITEEITHLFEVMAEASLPEPLSDSPTHNTEMPAQDDKVDPLH